MMKRDGLRWVWNTRPGRWGSQWQSRLGAGEVYFKSFGICYPRTLWMGNACASCVLCSVGKVIAKSSMYSSSESVHGIDRCWTEHNPSGIEYWWNALARCQRTFCPNQGTSWKVPMFRCCHWRSSFDVSSQKRGYMSCLRCCSIFCLFESHPWEIQMFRAVKKWGTWWCKCVLMGTLSIKPTHTGLLQKGSCPSRPPLRNSNRSSPPRSFHFDPLAV